MAQVGRRVLEWLYFLVGQTLSIGLLAPSAASLVAGSNMLKSVPKQSRTVVLLTTVLLSWGFVIYATRLAAKWQLEEDYPMQTHNF